jgi:hypothetical protein
MRDISFLVSPIPDRAFLSSRFSRICSASASLRLRVSARNACTSLLVAWRAVSPARRFFPASRTPSTSCNTGSPRCLLGGTARRCSLRHAVLPGRCGSSLRLNTTCASCAGCPGQPVRRCLSSAWIFVSSSFPYGSLR